MSEPKVRWAVYWTDPKLGEMYAVSSGQRWHKDRSPAYKRYLFESDQAAHKCAAEWPGGRLVRVTLRPKKPPVEKSLGEVAREQFLAAGGGWHNATAVREYGLVAKTGEAVWEDFAELFAAEVRRREKLP